jgi:hypothetical protein
MSGILAPTRRLPVLIPHQCSLVKAQRGLIMTIRGEMVRESRHDGREPPFLSADERPTHMNN